MLVYWLGNLYPLVAARINSVLSLGLLFWWLMNSSPSATLVGCPDLLLPVPTI